MLLFCSVIITTHVCILSFNVSHQITCCRTTASLIKYVIVGDVSYHYVFQFLCEKRIDHHIFICRSECDNRSNLSLWSPRSYVTVTVTVTTRDTTRYGAGKSVWHSGLHLRKTPRVCCTAPGSRRFPTEPRP